MHIESFDVRVLKQVAPAKARIGVNRFIETWKRSVEIFGENQVESFIIDGSKIMSEIGAYPFILSLRPIPGSLMEDAVPAEAYRIMSHGRNAGQGVSDAGRVLHCLILSNLQM
ncbi:MAG: protein, radical SAM [Candidatus Syntrophoarchaeum caldarius]|uniref:Protein, radical SAM n=1 Tax=Candidatus Syntropharchaeum caldarium TaxID=1838285 RepID=A0A1F2P913_9EURY|nr:MAG: protein, radical SAM [Candidatus Syntrophoarchaeum caldarius]